MESTLLFFLVGLSIFAAKYVAKNQPDGTRLLVFFASGTLAGGIVGLAAGSPFWPMVAIPRISMAAVGGLAAIIIYGSEKANLTNKPGIRYFATIFLGLVLAGLCYGFMRLYMTLAQLEFRTPSDKTVVILVWVFIGFLTMFGYTFPERWFFPQKGRNKTE